MHIKEPISFNAPRSSIDFILCPTAEKPPSVNISALLSCRLSFVFDRQSIRFLLQNMRPPLREQFARTRFRLVVIPPKILERVDTDVSYRRSEKDEVASIEVRGV